MKAVAAALSLISFCLVGAQAFAAAPSCESLFKRTRAVYPEATVSKPDDRARSLEELRAQGDLSLKDIHEDFYGGDLRHISPDSMLGEYLAQTGAKTKIVRFETYGSGPGPRKLLVAVSEKSWPTLLKTVLQSPNMMSIVGHAATMYNGYFFPNEGGKGGKIPRMPRMNELMPMLLMKTTEAERFATYTWMTADPRFDGWHDGLKVPWRNPEYCAVGGYACCTHWVANIPIGDRLVSRYSFPPNFEQPGPRTPRIANLRPYSPAAGKEDLRNVWKVPGHQQLASVIGQRQSNVRGEMASPGSLQMVLYARTAATRVPVVFWVTDDHTADIPDDFPIFSEPIN